MAAREINFTDDELQRIEEIAPKGGAAGDRYATEHISSLNR